MRPSLLFIVFLCSLVPLDGRVIQFVRPAPIADQVAPPRSAFAKFFQRSEQRIQRTLRLDSTNAPRRRSTHSSATAPAHFWNTGGKTWWQWTLGAVLLGLSIWFPPLRLGRSMVRGVQRIRRSRSKGRGIQLAIYIGLYFVLLAIGQLSNGFFFGLLPGLTWLSVGLLGVTLIIRSVRYLQNTRVRPGRLRRGESMVLPSQRDAERELQRWNIGVLNLLGLVAGLAMLSSDALNTLTGLLLLVTLANLLFLLNRYVWNRGREKIARADPRRIRVSRERPRSRPQPPVVKRVPRRKTDLPKPKREPKYSPPTPDDRMQNLSVIAMVLGILFLIFMIGGG